MKKYELVYIIDPELENDTPKISQKVKGFIEKRGGEVLNEEIWGKKKLAYSIKKHDFGVYVLVTFQIEPKNAPAVDKDLRLQEEIIRQLIVIQEEYTKLEPKKTERELREKKERKKEETEKPKVNKKEVKVDEKAEKERLKKLDEKLEEIVGKE